MNKWFRRLIVGLGLALLFSEAAYFLAEPYGTAFPEGSCAVIALGYPSESNGSPSTIQRFRVETAVAVFREHSCGELILSGGAVSNRFVEAESMAEVARELDIEEEELRIETYATDTWENVACSLPGTEEVRRVFMVSDSLHAQRAVRYACRQNPEDCSRYHAHGARPGVEHTLWKLPAAINELTARVNDALGEEDRLASIDHICTR